MLGPIGSEIMAIFRLLSPHEIDKYIKDEKPRKIETSLPMAAGGESLQYDGDEPHLEEQARKFPKDHQAKIIPINPENAKSNKPKNEEIQKTSEAIASSPSTSMGESGPARRNSRNDGSGGSDLESLGILSARSIREQEEQRLREENSKKDSATVFLLKHREKMRESRKRIIEQHAINSYQKNASQEFYEESDDDLLEEERGQGEFKGILFNKKHY